MSHYSECSLRNLAENYEMVRLVRVLVLGNATHFSFQVLL